MAGGNKQEKQTTTQSNTSSISNLAPASFAQPSLLNLVNAVSATPASLTGNESAALDRLVASGSAGNPFTGAIGGVANTLLSGGGPDRTGMATSAYDTLTKSLTPFAGGAYVDPSKNPALRGYLDVAGTDAANSVNSLFAGAGRDLSGAHVQALGRGITQAEAPILSDAYNRAISDQINAINTLYGAGNTTTSLLSGLDQTRLGNMATGTQIGASFPGIQNAGDIQVLQAEAQRRGIPLQTLLTQLGAIGPVAAQFGTQTQVGTGTGTSNEVTEQKPNILNQILGGAIGGVGLLGGLGGFGKNGWLYSTGDSGGGLFNGLSTRFQ